MFFIASDSTLGQFQVVDLLKHSTPRHKQQPISFPCYPYKTISHYLTIQNTLQAPTIDNVFHCHRKPYGPASSDTLSRWVKDTLQLAGIDTGRFTAHSCRAASTSKADSKGIPLKHILMAGQWSKKTNFYRFYCRMIETDDRDEDTKFALSVCLGLSTHFFCVFSLF